MSLNRNASKSSTRKESERNVLAVGGNFTTWITRLGIAVRAKKGLKHFTLPKLQAVKAEDGEKGQEQKGGDADSILDAFKVKDSFKICNMAKDDLAVRLLTLEKSADQRALILDFLTQLLSEDLLVAVQDSLYDPAVALAAVTCEFYGRDMATLRSNIKCQIMDSTVTSFSSVAEYCNSIKGLYRELEAAGDSVDDTDKVLNLLRGLKSEPKFDVVRKIIRTKLSTVTFEKAVADILGDGQDNSITTVLSALQDSKPGILPPVPNENYSELKDPISGYHQDQVEYKYRGHYPGVSSYPSHDYLNNIHNIRGGYRGGRSRGGRRGRGSGFPVICHGCGEPGHIRPVCPYKNPSNSRHEGGDFPRNQRNSRNFQRNATSRLHCLQDEEFEEMLWCAQDVGDYRQSLALSALGLSLLLLLFLLFLPTWPMKFQFALPYLVLGLASHLCGSWFYGLTNELIWRPLRGDFQALRDRLHQEGSWRTHIVMYEDDGTPLYEPDLIDNKGRAIYLWGRTASDGIGSAIWKDFPRAVDDVLYEAHWRPISLYAVPVLRVSPCLALLIYLFSAVGAMATMAMLLGFISFASRPDDGLCMLEILFEGLMFADSSQVLFYLDSGASSHHIGDIRLFSKVWNCLPRRVHMANGSLETSTRAGCLTIPVRGGTKIILNDALYTPGLRANFISVSKLVQEGYYVNFDKVGCTIKSPDGRLVYQCQPSRGLYAVEIDDESALFATEAVSCRRHGYWHRLFGHMSLKTVKMTIPVIKGLTPLQKDLHEVQACESCGVCKRKKTRYYNVRRGPQSLSRMHSDVKGPIHPTCNGSRYFVTFIHDKSRYAKVFAIKTRDEVLSCAIKAMAFFERQGSHDSGLCVKEIVFDGAKEYLSKAMTDAIEQRGIIISPSPPYTPQLNGVAESFNGVIYDIMSTMLHNARLPKSMWGYSLMHAVWLYNRSVRAGAATVEAAVATPVELLTGIKPSLKGLVCFGSVGYALVPTRHRDPGGLGDKGEKARFLGMGPRFNSYLVLLHPSRVLLRDSMIWYDDVYSFADIHGIQRRTAIPEGDQSASSSRGSIPEGEREDSKHVDVLEGEAVHSNDGITPSTSDESPATVEAPLLLPAEIKSGTRKSIRTKKGVPPPRPGFNCGLFADNVPSSDETLFGLGVNELGVDPHRYRDAMRDPHAKQWEKAIEAEWDNLHSHGTFLPVPIEPSQRYLGTLWVFKTKTDADGHLLKRKARLVAQGFRQIPGRDYTSTYAPTCDIDTVRLLLCVALVLGYFVGQLDFSGAFLNGVQDVPIYIRLPDGYHLSSLFKHLNPDTHCLKMVKCLYGCKNSASLWAVALFDLLVSLGFLRSQVDECLFFKHGPGYFLAVCIFVDDLIVLAPTSSQAASLATTLKQKYKLTYGGALHHFLGVKISRTANSFILDQSLYISELLRKHGMLQSNAVSTPMTTGFDYSVDSPSADITEYRQIVGGLLYLCVTSRPDISYSVSCLCRFMHAPTMVHLSAAKRVLRYLRGSHDLALVLRPRDLVLRLCCDASHGSCALTGRGSAGFFASVGGACFSWKSKLQTYVSKSSGESEIGSINDGIRPLFFFARIFVELQIPIRLPLLVLTDSQVAISACVSERLQARNKTIRIHFHRVRELSRWKHIRLVHVPGPANPSDTLTKALPRDSFLLYRSIIMGHTSFLAHLHAQLSPIIDEGEKKKSSKDHAGDHA